MGKISSSKRKELLQKAQSVARIGYWEVDLLKNTVTWSEITKEIHEVSPSYEPNLEEGINFYKEGEHRKKIEQLVTRAIEKGMPWDTELIIVTAKGKEVWVRAKGEVELKDGKAVSLFGTFQDIDEKKRSQLQYIGATERLALATSTAKIGIWEYDVIENELLWDDNMFSLYGIKREDFLGVVEAWESSVHPDDKERGQKEVQMALSGEKDFDTEFRIIKPDGEVRHIKASASVQRNGKGEPTKMIGINWDFTELKTTQLELQRQEESFVGAFNNSSIGMALVGLDGKWIQVNDSICKSVGYTREELMRLTFQDITHPEDLEKDLNLLHEVINGKRDSYQIEKRYFHKDKRLVHVLLTVTAVHHIDGSLSHFISQIVDITSRIEAEQQRERLHKITSDQNKDLLNFAHIVSHNLRSHSTNMNMLIDFLKIEKNEREIENIKSMLESASRGLNETVAHLNEVVQIKTTTLEKMKPVMVLSAINKVLDNIKAMVHEKDPIIDLSINSEHVINAVPAYLDSILLNLFTNSLKYCSPKRKLEIKISTSVADDQIVLKFEDNGLGIDMKRHEGKVFGMFKTFHNHPDAKGIGLFITKNQIESMGGHISVKSQVDKGATFFITFEKSTELRENKK